MKSIAISGALILFFLITNWWVPAKNLAVQAGLVAVASHVDLGDVVRESDHKIQYELKNDTAKKIRILAVLPSCSCGTASVSSSAIPEKSQGTVEINWHAPSKLGAAVLSAGILWMYEEEDGENWMTVTAKSNVVE